LIIDRTERTDPKLERSNTDIIPPVCAAHLVERPAAILVTLVMDKEFIRALCLRAEKAPPT
jgi:hypothetical protein